MRVIGLIFGRKVCSYQSFPLYVVSILREINPAINGMPRYIITLNAMSEMLIAITVLFMPINGGSQVRKNHAYRL